jgi:transcriptional regulator with XRE-family HTH domain
MSTAVVTAIEKGRKGRSGPQDVDRYVGARIRERRLLLGLTLQEMADLLGITWQQAYKYEKGLNRIAVSRLYAIAQTLRVDVAYFFEGLDDKHAVQMPQQQRMLLQLARNFSAISNRRHQEALCHLARVLGHEKPPHED